MDIGGRIVLFRLRIFAEEEVFSGASKDANTGEVV
jgi:hypothetical protein